MHEAKRKALRRVSRCVARQHGEAVVQHRRALQERFGGVVRDGARVQLLQVKKISFVLSGCAWLQLIFCSWCMFVCM